MVKTNQRRFVFREALPRRIGHAVAIVSGLAALGVITLQLVVFVLGLVFQAEATNTLTLLAWMISCAAEPSLAGGGGPIPLHGAVVTAWPGLMVLGLSGSLTIAGLAIVLMGKREVRHWWEAAALWSVALILGSHDVALVLLPALVSSILLALPIEGWLGHGRPSLAVVPSRRLSGQPRRWRHL